MSWRFAVVHEAEADFKIATELADRVLIEAVNWIDEDLIESRREWIAAAPAGRRLTWKTIPKLAVETRIRAQGHFDGKPGEADAAASRRAILYLLATFPDLNAIFLIRDQDDQPERKIGLEQARNHDRSGTLIIVGLAIAERESWVISGFDPRDEGETRRLAHERKTLGFDPRLQPHHLTACKDDQAKRSPKRVLRSLCDGDHDRERCCWMETPLQQLRERGAENGLARYLEEVRNEIGPLIGHDH